MGCIYSTQGGVQAATGISGHQKIEEIRCQQSKLHHAYSHLLKIIYFYVLGFSEGNSPTDSESPTAPEGAGSLLVAHSLGWRLHGPLPA